MYHLNSLFISCLCFISSSSSEGSLHINDETTPPPMHGRDTKLGNRRYRDNRLEGVQRW